MQRARAPLHRPGAAGKPNPARPPGAPGGWRVPLPKLAMPRLPVPLGRPNEQQKQQQEPYVVQEGFRPEPVALSEQGGGKPGAAQQQQQQASSLQQRVAGAFLAAAVAPAQQPPSQQQQAQQAAAQQQQAPPPQLQAPPPQQSPQQLAPPQQQRPPGLLAPPPGAPPPSAYDAASQQLAFARHLSTATNGLAPLASRLESLTYLVFTTGQAQGRLLAGPAADPASWLASGEGVALLERVYLLGQAVADLGAAADGAAGGGAGAASNGQRALAALDFAALLSRYLAQHGVTLREEFVAQLPYDWLQAKALHIGSCLETRCTVHRLAFERLIDRVGLEGAPAAAGAAAWGAGAGAAAPVTTIHNTTITSAQGGAAAASADADAAATAAATAPAAQQQGPLAALWVALVAVASALVRVVVASFMLAGGMAARLLALGALVRAVKAVAGSGAQGAGGGSSSVQGAEGGGGAGAGAAPGAAPQPALVAAAAPPLPAPVPGLLQQLPAPAAAAPLPLPLPLPLPAAAPAALSVDSATITSTSTSGGGAGSGNTGAGGKQQGPGLALPFLLPNPFRRPPQQPAPASAAAPVFRANAAYFEALRPVPPGGPRSHPLVPEALRVRPPTSGSSSDEEGGW